MAPPRQTLIRRSTNRVSVSALRDELTGDYVDASATVTAELLEGDGTTGVVVAGSAIALAYVPGTSGPQTTFSGVLPFALALPLATYTLRATAIDLVTGSQREFNVGVDVTDG